MFNPRPVIRQLTIPGHAPCIVIDDFMLDPQALAGMAARHQAGFTMAPNNAYPGAEILLPPDFNARLNEFFMLHIRRLLGARRTTQMFSRLSMVSLPPEQLSPLQRVCHHDNYASTPGQSFPAAVLYLFKDVALGGTSFYRPKQNALETQRLLDRWGAMSGRQFSQELGAEPAYLTASNDYFELIATVPAQWNRVIFYEGSIFHSAHITRPDLLSTDPARGRLTLNGFWVCRQTAGA